MKLGQELLERLMLPPRATLRQAIEALTEAGTGGMALIVDGQRHLLGIIVDSDIRRALLQGRTLETTLDVVMNKNPHVLPSALGREDIQQWFVREGRSAVPLVDDQNRVADLALLTHYMAAPEEHDNWVVLMAGGQGTRLRPLTESCPKPLVEVCGRPILEIIIGQFVRQGFRKFMISVNHMAGQIMNRIGDGGRWQARIEYLQEEKALGTAGALSLIRRKLEGPVIVMNGDLLTKVNFEALLHFHGLERNAATLCIRQYEYQVPYGVAAIDGQELVTLVEKPVYTNWVNAGIYVYEPEILARVPVGAAHDMTELISGLCADKKTKVGCFPLQESWVDIGRIEDYQRAVDQFQESFQ